jgi:hypothetical protein
MSTAVQFSQQAVLFALISSSLSALLTDPLMLWAFAAGAC